MSSGEHCGDDDAHGHGHSHDGAEPADGAAHGHGHSHGDGAGTPLVATDAKDGIVYYTAPDGRVLHSPTGASARSRTVHFPDIRLSVPLDRASRRLSHLARPLPRLSSSLKPHSHDPIPDAGSFRARRPRIDRDYSERSFTVGIGGPVGTGKTALMLSLCRHLRDGYDVAAIYGRHLHPRRRRIPREAPGAGSLAHPRGRDRGCPHAAIREDIGCNLTEAENLTAEHAPELILLESGGDNLAANFSRELADFIVYVIDVCGGDKIPRKGGPGVTQADLLVINKVELADAVGASLEVMARDAKKQRESGPLVMANVKRSVGVPEIAEHILKAWREATGGRGRRRRAMKRSRGETGTSIR